MKIILKKYLDSRNITSYWVIKQTGLTKKTFYDLVNNKTDGIKFNTLEKICHVLNCTPNDVVRDD